MNGIDAIVPISDAHRKRLDRLKANLQRLNARHEQEAAMSRVEAEMAKERLANVRELSRLRVALGEEIRDALFENSGEQTELVLRIAAKARAA